VGTRWAHKADTRQFSMTVPDIRKRSDLRKRHQEAPGGTSQTPTDLPHSPWVVGSGPSRPFAPRPCCLVIVFGVQLVQRFGLALNRFVAVINLFFTSRMER